MASNSAGDSARTAIHSPHLSRPTRSPGLRSVPGIVLNTRALSMLSLGVVWGFTPPTPEGLSWGGLGGRAGTTINGVGSPHPGATTLTRGWYA